MNYAMSCEYNAYRGIYFWPRSECISDHGQNYVSGGQNYVSGGLIPCDTCQVRFCDDKSGRAWIHGQDCETWFHNACLSLDEKGPGAKFSKTYNKLN